MGPQIARLSPNEPAAQAVKRLLAVELPGLIERHQSVPPSLRGRMAAIEQLSYMTGPLLGNARAGFAGEEDVGRADFRRNKCGDCVESVRPH